MGWQLLTRFSTVYKHGQCILEPITAEAHVISPALKLLGVTVGPDQVDEFEAVGLGCYRSNDDWIDGPHLS